MTSVIKEVDSLKPSICKFSICTLVNDKKEYEEMVTSFIDAGFDPSTCEYLYIDNSKENKYEAFAGISRFLSLSKGDYIIICHQDILLNFDKIDKLEKCINELNLKYPEWGLAGNAGGMHLARHASKIATAGGKIYHEGPLPSEVFTLDENFIIVKKSANIGISRDLKGFHLYGTDLCIIARILGYKAFAIDFLITHKSYGNANESFYRLKRDLIKKYKRALKGTFLKTTITSIYVSGSFVKSKIFNTKPIIKIVKFYYKAKKQLNIY